MVLGLKLIGKPSTQKKITSFGQNQGLVWSSDSTYGETKYSKENYKFWIESRPCMVLRLKPIGKPSTQNKNYKFWTEPRPCMVLGLKPMGKPSIQNKNYKF